MRIAFYGDSLTEGIPGASYFRLLKQRFPQHHLLNYGQGDDTAFSLRRRIIRYRLNVPVDLAFVWVGTNDVPFKVSPLVSMAKKLRGKPWARNPDEFREHYEALIRLLSTSASKLITVSPSIMGEQPDNMYNGYLAQLAEITRDVSADYPNTTYLDLRRILLARLGEEAGCTYLPRSVTRTLLDALASASDARIDRLAARRGLCLTVDGVHLNSTGAQVAADTFAALIDAAA